MVNSKSFFFFTALHHGVLSGAIPKRDLHAAEMFIANCCRRLLRDDVVMSSGCAQMSTAQSSDVYIESHFGYQTDRQTDRQMKGQTNGEKTRPRAGFL